MAQTVDSNVQVVRSGFQRHFGPEKINKLVGGAEFPRVEQKPLEERLYLVPAPHCLLYGLLLGKQAELSEEIGPVVSSIFTLAWMSQALLIRQHGCTLQ